MPPPCYAALRPKTRADFTKLYAPHLRKKEVRQAIAYAINRAEMLDSFYEGGGTGASATKCCYAARGI